MDGKQINWSKNKLERENGNTQSIEGSALSWWYSICLTLFERIASFEVWICPRTSEPKRQDIDHRQLNAYSGIRHSIYLWSAKRFEITLNIFRLIYINTHCNSGAACRWWHFTFKKHRDLFHQIVRLFSSLSLFLPLAVAKISVNIVDQKFVDCWHHFSNRCK